MTEHPYSSMALTSEAVKVLAHPLRSRLLGALRKNGPQTATTLASELGTNSGTASYHLRKLESVGLVHDTGQGKGKERLWDAATDSHSWTPSSFAGNEDASTALGWLVRNYLTTFTRGYGQWLDAADNWPLDWQDALGMSDMWVQVTCEQLQSLNDEIDALLDKYLHAGTGDEDATRVHVYVTRFPLAPDVVPGSGEK